MQHPFPALAPEYDALLARMVITRSAAVESAAHRLLAFVDQGCYAPVSARTDIPQPWMATSFEREASSDFRLNPAQGDPWNRPSVHVPRGRGPFPDWQSAAIDAYHLDGIDRVGAANWTWARACYEGEVFNGMGYRAHGIHSPYLWAGTNNYTSGKYVADGVWSAAAIDSQLGIIPMMARMVALRPALALPGAVPIAPDAPPIVPQPPPRGLGGTKEETEQLQRDLNKLLGLTPPLDDDGDYGRLTRDAVRQYEISRHLAVDRGIAGPQVLASIKKELA